MATNRRSTMGIVNGSVDRDPTAILGVANEEIAGDRAQAGWRDMEHPPRVEVLISQACSCSPLGDCARAPRQAGDHQRANGKSTAYPKRRGAISRSATAAASVVRSQRSNEMLHKQNRWLPPASVPGDSHLNSV